MNDKLYKISCDPVCAFSVQSHSRDEAKMYAKDHAKKMHKLDSTDAELESMVVEV